MNKAIVKCDCTELQTTVRVCDKLSVTMCDRCGKIYNIEGYGIKIDQVGLVPVNV